MDQDVFLNLLIMAAADGSIAESELGLLAHRAAEWGITDEQFEDALEKAASGRAELTVPNDPAERKLLLKELVRMMAADGKLSDSEKQLFAVFSSASGIGDEELNRLIDEVIGDDS
ncbi:MAG: hypothetical protein KDA92_18965 [Planctomycetales bacterium]|nr:hypothetical protein [Planctomycetales bacterium]MCA9170708.1 hypothetical protein [Planctomycetales bacterium]